LIGTLPLEQNPPGRELVARRRPGWSLSDYRMIWSIRPKGTSAKNWTAPRAQSHLQFEWIALGFYCCVFLDRAVALDHDAGKTL
jgi:hypothetical protein